MKRKITMLAVLMLGIAVTSSWAQIRIGYINPQEVLQQLPERQAIEQQLAELIEEKEADFSAREEAFLARVREVQERVEAGTISDSQLETERASLEVEQEELTELVRSQQLDVQRRQQELLQPVLESIDQAIEEVATELGLAYVLNEMTSDGEMILLFISAEGENTLNITGRVADKLK
ncbi:MAG: outer membrane protein [Bacteroidetes bacterium HLUCCA01]|nr:MAG: outer membrane protein [Bacteroidetes bacterium HLUCCA01]